MARPVLIFVSILAALFAFVYQLHLKPILTALGVGRVIQAVGNDACFSVPDLQACESQCQCFPAQYNISLANTRSAEIVLHQPTGILYLACSTPGSRVHWTPAADRLNSAGRSTNDYVATYDPSTSLITRLKFSDVPGTRGLSLHGMDVVPSAQNTNELFVYLVNHRVPLQGDSRHIGADSSIEVFRTSVGSSVLTHIRTVEDPLVILTPNDIVGSSDGRSFFFTNDHGEKTGIVSASDFFLNIHWNNIWRQKRYLDVLGRKSTSVGFCHVEDGCKFAITGMHASNGIARAQNDTFYVANVLGGPLSVLERQDDNSLVLTDLISVGQYAEM